MPAPLPRHTRGKRGYDAEHSTEPRTTPSLIPARERRKRAEGELGEVGEPSAVLGAHHGEIPAASAGMTEWGLGMTEWGVGMTELCARGEECASAAAATGADRA